MIEPEPTPAPSAPATTQRWSWPPLFGLLEFQFGAAVGFLQTAVPYWLKQDGVSLVAIGALSGAAFSPHAWKVAWVPLLDLGSRRKTWYIACTIATALLLFACAVLPDPAKHLGVYGALLFALQATASTAHAALNGLMAITTRAEDKGRTGGWQMAGNVGSTSLIGALTIALASRWSPPVVGTALAVITLGSGLGILWVHEQRTAAEAIGSFVRKLLGQFGEIVKDLVRTAISRDGIATLVLCLVPVSCGALTNLFSAMAADYQVDEHWVELINGPGMGVTGAVGSLIGGFCADRLNRKLNYALWGGITGLCALAMAAGPMNPTTYFWGTLSYSLANGAGFAAFAGMVLEMVKGGAAVTTKYTLFVAASNLAISYTTALDGRASVFRGIGTRASIAFDGMITYAGIAVVIGLFFFLRRRAAPASAGA